MNEAVAAAALRLRTTCARRLAGWILLSTQVPTCEMEKIRRANLSCAQNPISRQPCRAIDETGVPYRRGRQWEAGVVARAGFRT